MEGNLQESKLEIAVDLGLEGDLNVEVQVEPQPERVALAAAAARLLRLLLHGTARDAAERVGDTPDEAAGCLADVVEGEAVEGPAAALLLLLALLPAYWWGVVGLFAVRLVDLRLLLPPGLLLVGAASGCHFVRWVVWVCVCVKRKKCWRLLMWRCLVEVEVRWCLLVRMSEKRDTEMIKMGGY